MKQSPNNAGGGGLRDPNKALETRLLRSMIVSIAIAVVLTAIFASWRVLLGLALGGLLSILNYRWLHRSATTLLSIGLSSQQPRLSASLFLLRYLVVGAAVFAAYNLQIISLTGALVGLCAFVPALFIEAAREFYFAIIHREESR
ncbi:MAG TPA: ATP synthase subunit I [Pyrinomonadaceae bacterium]|jgi:hypothetical protein|nr:ATP synthase subunit I [Pyrinomonadaceae bacterium]